MSNSSWWCKTAQVVTEGAFHGSSKVAKQQGQDKLSVPYIICSLPTIGQEQHSSSEVLAANMLKQ